MRVFLSFDDGRLDAYSAAYAILHKSNLRASFHITTGFVDGTYITDGFGIGRKPVTIDMLKEMAENGNDISSHGDKHIVETNDFRTCLAKLTQWGVCNGKAGLAVPNSSITNEELRSFLSENRDLCLYVRLGRSPRCYSFFRKVAFVLYRYTRLQAFFNYFNKPNIIGNTDRYSIRSLVIRNTTKADSLIRFIEKHKSEDANLVIMLHSIVQQPSDVWEWSEDNFRTLTKYLAAEQTHNNLQVCTLKEF